MSTAVSRGLREVGVHLTRRGGVSVLWGLLSCVPIAVGGRQSPCSADLSSLPRRAAVNGGGRPRPGRPGGCVPGRSSSSVHKAPVLIQCCRLVATSAPVVSGQRRGESLSALSHPREGRLG